MLLIVLFIIIKANPYYYICQNMPATGRAIKKGISISKHNNQQAFLIKFDKSITESIDDQNVPDIKFTGIPFILFFCSLFLTFSTLKTGLSVKYPVFKNEGCIRLCILRL
ncbi:MAG TPA: hypothetical protein VIM89_11330 [Mucilaginibacter sp.]